MGSAPVLEFSNLHVRFFDEFDVVSGLSFSVQQGETLCIVGESGCGKSMSALSALGLLPPMARISEGEIRLDGRNIADLSDRDLRKVRGKEIAMIFQEPMSSLNPLMTVGEQIAEVLVLHQDLSRKAALERAAELLEIVQIPDAQRRLSDYPHQLSGGMRQRVMIAIALACNPRVLLADEPTTALDVTVQAQITDLLGKLQQDFGTAIVLITHDMGLVAENADRVVVMYAGRKVEEASVERFFSQPSHPYSRGLLGALPKLGSSLQEKSERLREIPGVVPKLSGLPAGCPFQPRCGEATSVCAEKPPPFEVVDTNHIVACWHPAR
ncbi:ABC transporter ATP-binding protein [Aquamicrobium ahrensii]|uniref:Peptide/nickel transport system ATP-binding protein n=1 Tax=Aquamicrobium ahrensii TaxID=469551 RepID=A0ABV2KPC9_9HYPH